MKTILITGSTDGIGLSAANMLVAEGHKVLVHGRNAQKLEKVLAELRANYPEAAIDGFIADLSDLAAVRTLASEMIEKYGQLDVLINNAGVFGVANPMTESGLDVRFVVNTIAPYLLAKLMLPVMSEGGRIVNLSSAAQAPVDPRALAGERPLNHSNAYAQSKLALTMWSALMGHEQKGNGIVVVSVNPKSFLGSKMVKENYGMEGYDVNIGGEILRRAAEDDSFEDAFGKYFDNDSGRFASPHPDAMNSKKCQALVEQIEGLI